MKQGPRKSITIRELAELCGCSPATVSRALNGRALVSPDIREKIIEVATAHHYVFPARMKRNVVVVLTPTFRHSFYQAILEEMRLSCAQLGFDLMALPDQLSEATVDFLRQERPALLVLLDENYPADSYSLLLSIPSPIVICGGLARRRNCAAVHVDDLRAAYDGMNWLLDLGHRQIGILSDPKASYGSGFLRLSGCHKAFVDRGLPFPEQNVSEEGATYDMATKECIRLLRQNPEITAFFCLSGDAAAGCWMSLIRHGYQVPLEFSVLGFDGVPPTANMSPSISSVRQPVRELVLQSLRFADGGALQVSAGDGAKRIVSIQVEHELMDRGTVIPRELP